MAQEHSMSAIIRNRQSRKSCRRRVRLDLSSWFAWFVLLAGKRQWWQWSGQSFCFTDAVIRPAITVHTVQWTHFTSFSVKMSVHFNHYCGSLLNRRELPVLLYFFLLANNCVCFIWSTLTIVDASPVVVQRAQSLKYIHTQKMCCNRWFISENLHLAALRPSLSPSVLLFYLLKAAFSSSPNTGHTQALVLTGRRLKTADCPLLEDSPRVWA